MKIEESHVVTLHYSVYNTSEELLDSSHDDEPLVFMQGRGFVIPGLDNGLLGKQAGDKFTLKVASEDAYGEYSESLVQQVPLSMFEGMDVEPGMQFRATTDDGDIPVIITEVAEDEATVDANHPLAGLDLVFDVEIIDVRVATEEELAHGHAHEEAGCGHDHGEDDGCCGHKH